RLGGLRHRYNRFGYENCGRMYQASFNEHNRKCKFNGVGEDVVIEKIERTDLETLKAAQALHAKCAIAVERRSDNDYADVYASMVAWKNVPYAAKKNGKTIGYLCANERGDVLAENYAESVEAMVEMLCAWQKRVGTTVYFYLYPHEAEYIRLFYGAGEGVSIKAPCHFKFIRWEKVVSAFMKLKASYTQMPCGELRLGIEGYGVLRLFVDETGAGCERIDGAADIVLDGLKAARYLFGVLPPECTAEASALAKAWLPLPLSWNLQDRV
ncbi:MAG: hypothetical protein IJ514_04290, partial [Clostridia bacterium]|nr:hypothetical protein [Clostridia bacterium]